MTLNLAQLRALTAVLDTGGFGAAADELGISQSAVSHAIAALERVLQAPVVLRTNPVRPTALGERILPHARAAVVSADAVAAIADRHLRAPAGVIRLAAPQTACQGLLPGLLRQWAADYPKVRVRIFEGDDEELVSWLEAGTVDASVLIDPDPVPAGARLLAEDAFHALVRRDHPLAGAESLEIRDLEEDPFLLSEGGCEPRIRDIWRRSGVRFVPVHRIRELATLIGMVQAGIGVSVVPGLTQAMIPSDVVLVPVRPRASRRLYLTGPRTRPWHPAVGAMISAGSGPGRGADLGLG